MRTSPTSGVATVTSRSGARGAWLRPATPLGAPPPGAAQTRWEEGRGSPCARPAARAPRGLSGGCVTPSPRAPGLVLPNARREERPLPLSRRQCVIPPGPQPSCSCHPGRGAPMGIDGHRWAPVGQPCLCRRPSQAVQAFPSAPPRAHLSPPCVLGLLRALSCLHESPSLPLVLLSQATGNINLKSHQMRSFSEPWTAASCLLPPASSPAARTTAGSAVCEQSHCPVRLPSLDRHGDPAGGDQALALSCLDVAGASSPWSTVVAVFTAQGLTLCAGGEAQVQARGPGPRPEARGPSGVLPGLEPLF